MPIINDYECGICEAVLRDITIHVLADVPQCCGQQMAWLPSFGHGGVSALRGFSFNGKAISSLREADALERTTAQQAAEGVPGASAIRFRALHQNASNMDVNTFGPPPDQTVPKARRGGKAVPIRRLTPDEAARHLE